MPRWSLRLAASLFAVSVAGAVDAQFFEGFDAPTGLDGWEFLTGDGEARMQFVAGGNGFASILVDATADRRNVWWALIKRRVSDRMDLARLGAGGHELRVEARIRVSHAPRRVNLHLNTQRTTDFHRHLMEFDIPDSERWHTISMTTRGFDGRPGDQVFGQLALMDWGRESYRVDVDYFKVDVVDQARIGPDLGEPVAYHPPIPDPGTFRQQVRVAEDAVIDLANPDANLLDWSTRSGAARRRVVTVNGSLVTILRFDLSAFRGRRMAGSGLLELATHSVLRPAGERKDFGLVRVVEILGGDPVWRRDTVTTDTLCRGERLEAIVNGQMIIDWPVHDGEGRPTYFTIPRPVLQRMIDRRTLGLALLPLGSIDASFYALEPGLDRPAARLLFNVDE
jgi:hypothetical protein